jgi:hypothetical protein
MPSVAVVSSARFTFSSFSGSVTELSVETPSAVLADMSDVSTGARNQVIVPTGELSGGTITVGFMSSTDPQSLVGIRAPLTFSSTAYSVSRNVILESASVDVRIGETVRGALKFRITDYFGS